MSLKVPVVSSTQDEENLEQNQETEVGIKVSSIQQKPIQRKKPALKSFKQFDWLLHLHYIRHQHEICLKMIEERIKETKNRCEYPIHVKAMIMRSRGEIQQSIKLFQQCHKINPKNSEYLKQIGKGLMLLGKYKKAIECFEMVRSSSGSDWEVAHHSAMCLQSLKDFEAAEKMFIEALNFSQYVITYQLWSKVCLEKNDLKKAIQVLKKGLSHFPENVQLLTSLGLLYLQNDHFHKSFELLGKSLTFDPENFKAILAAGSLMQQHGDFDVALSKYRIAAKSSPQNSSLWNNIAMCFFGKKKLVAAISCLKRAHYLSPFDWRVLYNLSLLHLNMQQYASAFQFASTAIKLNRDHAGLYLLLAISLVYLEQVTNAEQAFNQALNLSENSPHLLINFASFQLHICNKSSEASSLLHRFNKLEVNKDAQLQEAAKKLEFLLNIGTESDKNEEK